MADQLPPDDSVAPGPAFAVRTLPDEGNRPPADELFLVRDEIKRLTGRERDLRSLMLSDPSARTGNHYLVEIRDVQTTRTDLKELRAVHPDIAEQFTFKVTEQRVELRGISEDGEILSLRKLARIGSEQ